MSCTVALVVLCFCFVHQGYSDRIVLQTLDQNGTLYQFFPLRTKTLQFSVKATNDIHVCLTNQPHLSGAYYEIVIGAWANTKCLIRKDNGEHQVEYNDSVIKPGRFQRFIITMNDNEGSISVGKKEGDPFMYFLDSDYVKMSYFGISTGYGSKGEWNFDFETLYCNCTTCSK